MREEHREEIGEMSGEGGGEREEKKGGGEPEESREEAAPSHAPTPTHSGTS